MTIPRMNSPIGNLNACYVCFLAKPFDDFCSLFKAIADSTVQRIASKPGERRATAQPGHDASAQRARRGNVQNFSHFRD